MTEITFPNEQTLGESGAVHLTLVWCSSQIDWFYIFTKTKKENKCFQTETPGP